jgi:hypothetical protein
LTEEKGLVEAGLAELRAAPELVRVPLLQLCYGRSGDKGDTANIGK